MDYIDVFKPNLDEAVNSESVQKAMECMNKFASAFEAENTAAMDACLHFPHYLLSGNDVICWDNPGQLSKSFFNDLKNMGFQKTVIDYISVILATTDKVHLKYGYSRIADDGHIMSKHNNVWILTKKEGAWGILLRSY